VNLSGTEFYIDGAPLDDLVFNAPFTLMDRDVTLSGLLADGSSFLFDLNSNFVVNEDFFSPDATLTLTLVATGLAGDYNNDGVVDAMDYAVWRENLNEPAGALPNDVDGGAIGSAQYETFVANYGATRELGSPPSAAAPEPASVAILCLAGLALLATRKTHVRQ